MLVRGKSHINIIIACFLTLFLQHATAQQTIVIANGLPGCLPVVTQVGVVCGGGTSQFGVIGNEFIIQNIDGASCCAAGGDFNSYFEFAQIDISEYSNVMVSLDYLGMLTSGAFEDDSPGAPVFGCTNTIVDNSHDQMVFYYVLDGVPIQDLYVHGTTEADFTGTWNIGPLNGNTLSIRVYGSNKAGHEIFKFSNLVITADTDISAGPDKIACVNMPTMLDGVGAGVWSGGAGVFSDIMIPTPLYTPDMSELSTSVTLTYTSNPAYPGCPTASDDMMLMVNPDEDATFAFPDFCAGAANGPTGIVTPGGTFSFNPDPGGGVTIDPTTGVISGAMGGDTYTVEYTTGGNCPGTHQEDVTIMDGPTGTLTGSDMLCPNDCTTFSFSFSGGSGTYDINLTANPGGFNFSIPGITAADVITICYQGLVPLFDPSTLTLSIPTIFSGSGTISLIGITDANGCMGTASGDFNLTLLGLPTANNAGPLTVCPDANGDGDFDLTSLETTILGGGAGTVNWWLNSDGTGAISNPSSFISAPTVVYATVSNGTCESSVVAINLFVQNNQPSFISMLCAASMTNACDICVTTPTVELSFIFGDNFNYDVTVMNLGTGITYSGTVSNITALQVPISGTSTFQLESVQLNPGCPNFNTYNEQVVITVVQAPTIDQPDIMPSCHSIILPPITGQNLSSDAGYFSGVNGTGVQYFPGQEIFNDISLYIYDDVSGCVAEIPIVIDILPQIQYNAIADTTVCISYTLPPITGAGVTPTTAYYYTPSAGTTHFVPGSVIDTTVTLYIFDPEVDENCVAVEESLHITIADTVPTPLLAVDCSLGEGMGQILVFTPFGDGYSFKIDTFAFQNDSIFSTLDNKTYQIIVKNDTTGCVSKPATIDVNCGCAVVQTLDVNPQSYTTCGTQSINFSDVVFTNSSAVTVSTTGAGTLNQTTFASSPAKISYTPSQSDIGKTLTFTLISTDPDGVAGPCSTISKDIILVVGALPIPMITGPDKVCTGGSVTLTVSTADKYLWSNSQTTQAITVNNVTSAMSFTVTVTDQNGCKGSTLQSVSVGQITAGTDNNTTLCKEDIPNFDLTSLLDTNANSGGKWYLNNNVINPNTYNFGALNVGQHTFYYIIDDPLCGKDTAAIALQVLKPNNAGSNNAITLCNFNTPQVNLVLPLGSHDTGGQWVVPSGLNIDITDPSRAKLINAAAGTFDLLYIVGTNSCVDDTATITLVIQGFVSAGTDVNSSICQGATIDLEDYVSTNHGSGKFEPVGTIGGFSGSTWNTTGIANGTYTFRHIVNNANPCQADTAVLKLNITNSLTAGPDVTKQVCVNTTVNLSDFIQNGDQGGKFYLNGVEVASGTYTVQNTPAQVTFIYKVGDGIICPEDQANLTLAVVTKPSLNLGGDIGYCVGDAGILTIPSSVSNNSTLFFTLTTQNNVKYRQTLSLNQTNRNVQFQSDSQLSYNFNNLPIGTHTLVLDSVAFVDACTFDYNLPVKITVMGLQTKSVNISLCPGGTFTVGNDVYDQSNPTGQTIVTNSTGCDSIYTVNLNFLQNHEGNLDTTLCSASQSIIVGNQVFNLANPSGSVVLLRAGSNGCDSIVNVNIDFENMAVAEGKTTITTCDADYFVDINGIRFDRLNPTGSVTLAGASYLGCDSIHKVELVFIDFDSDVEAVFNCDSGVSSLRVLSATASGPFDIQIDNDLYVGISLPHTIDIDKNSVFYKITSKDNCVDTATVGIPQYDVPNISLDSSELSNGGYQLTVNGDLADIYDYTWSGSTDLSCLICFDPLVSPVQTTNYSFTYHYGDLCAETQTIQLRVEEAVLVIPNIFTPNGDNKNDKFVIVIPKKFSGTISAISVYDRWGNLVYHQNDPTQTDGWDGRYGGKDAEQGVYVYKIDVIKPSAINTEYLTGTLTLLR